MANNISVTQGAGTLITTDQIGADSSHAQVIKLAESVAGSRNYIPAAVATGLLVNVSQVQSTVTVGGSVSITGTPAVAQSGVWNVGITGTPAVTITSGSVSITGTAAATQSGVWNVGITGTAAATQSGTWNIGTVATVTNPVTVTGTVALSGTSPVSGTVTVNQGTAAAAANAWVVKISDGTNTAPLDAANANALKVSVVAQVGGGVSLADTAAFTAGTTAATPVQGVFNDGLIAVGSGKVAAVRITSFRAQHANLRDNSGNEVGIAAAPLRVDPTGTTTQPVSGTVTANQGGAPWIFNQTQINGAAVTVAAAGVQTVSIVGAGGTAFSQAAALATQNGPSVSAGQTAWKFSATISTASSSTTLHTPAGGKTAYIEGIVIVVAGTPPYTVTVYDNTNAAANTIFAGFPAQGTVVITPARPIPLSAVNNLLRVDVGSGTPNVSISVWGYDA